jgi:hypothetical protein
VRTGPHPFINDAVGGAIAVVDVVVIVVNSAALRFLPVRRSVDVVFGDVDGVASSASSSLFASSFIIMAQPLMLILLSLFSSSLSSSSSSLGSAFSSFPSSRLTSVTTLRVNARLAADATARV